MQGANEWSFFICLVLVLLLPPFNLDPAMPRLPAKARGAGTIRFSGGSHLELEVLQESTCLICAILLENQATAVSEKRSDCGLEDENNI